MTDEWARALGNDLAERRRAAGVTLEDMCRDTKIRRPILEAIEEGDLGKLPPDVFVVGFIKAYCDRLDMDPGPYIGRFVKRDHTEPEDPGEDASDAAEGRGAARWVIWVVVMVAVAAVALAVLWWTGILSLGTLEPVQPPPPPKGAGPSVPRVPANALAEPALPSTEPGRASEPLPKSTAGPSSSAAIESTGAVASPRTPAELPGADLVITCTQPCWLSLWADGERKVYRLLSPGETLSFTGSRFRADIGNAAGVQFTYRGRAVKLPDIENKVLKDFVIAGPAEAEKAP